MSALWALAAPVAAAAGTITLSAPPPAPYNTHFGTRAGSGGPFWAVTEGLDGPLAPDAFLTFCLELSENVALGTPYTYAISDYAKAGGDGPPGTITTFPDLTTGDKIDDETKWLYYMVRFGDYLDLIGDAGANTATKLASTGRFFQQAIWYFEGERTFAQLDAVAKNLVTLADAAVANGAWTDLEQQGHRVVAINVDKTLKNGSVAPGQDQLGYYSVPVPDGGSTLELIATMVPIGFIAYVTAISRQRMRRWRAN